MKRFLSQYGRLIAGRGLSAVLQALTLIVLARSSDIGTFGEYATGIAVGAIAIGVFSLGLPTLVLRSEARTETGVARTAMQLEALAAVGAVVVVCVCLKILVPNASSEVIVAAATFTGSELWLNLVQNLLLGSQREARATTVIVARRALPLACLGMSVLSGGSAFIGLAAGSVAASLAALPMVWYLRKRSSSMKSVLRRSRHYWTANIASMFQQLDVVLIRQGIGSPAAGAYSSAFRLASPVHIVTTAITSKMIPALSAAPDDAERAERGRKYLLTGAVYSGVILVAAPLAAWVGPFLLGEQYASWRWLFSMTFVNSAVSVLNQVQAGRLYGLGEAKSVSRATVISTLVGLAVVGYGALIGNLFVAVIGTISIQVLLLVILHILVRRGSK